MTMLAANRNKGLQEPLVAVQRLTQPELPTGKLVAAVFVPPGAIVTGGFISVETAFDSATSDTISVGDAASGTRYLNGGADNGSTTARVALVPTGYQYTTGKWITVKNVAVGTEGTAGKVLLVVEFIVEGRFCEIQGGPIIPADA